MWRWRESRNAGTGSSCTTTIASSFCTFMLACACLLACRARWRRCASFEVIFAACSALLVHAGRCWHFHWRPLVTSRRNSSRDGNSDDGQCTRSMSAEVLPPASILSSNMSRGSHRRRTSVEGATPKVRFASRSLTNASPRCNAIAHATTAGSILSLLSRMTLQSMRRARLCFAAACSVAVGRCPQGLVAVSNGIARKNASAEHTREANFSLVEPVHAA